MAECPTCGDVFDTNHGMRVHHAHIHDESLTDKTHRCTVCEEQFTRPESRLPDSDNVFCSKECHGTFLTGQRKSEHVTSACMWCGDTFEQRQSQHKKSEKSFCSHECHGNWKEQQGSVDVICENCGSTFRRNEWHIDNTEHHFCSNPCRANWLSENWNGESHPLWEGGPTPYYGPDWYSQRRKAIQRDDEQCCDCGMTRDQHYDEYGADLEVHHKTPIRTFNDTTEANKLTNLITVCTTCHMKRENS